MQECPKKYLKAIIKLFKAIIRTPLPQLKESCPNVDCSQARKKTHHTGHLAFNIYCSR